MASAKVSIGNVLQVVCSGGELEVVCSQQMFSRIINYTEESL